MYFSHNDKVIELPDSTNYDCVIDDEPIYESYYIDDPAEYASIRAEIFAYVSKNRSLHGYSQLRDDGTDDGGVSVNVYNCGYPFNATQIGGSSISTLGLTNLIWQDRMADAYEDEAVGTPNWEPSMVYRLRWVAL